MGKWGPLVAVCLGTFMLLVDVSIVVVALPAMAGGLGASLSDLQWVMDVYALVLAALLLAAGAAADVLGGRRIYAAGTVLFALASLGCGLATSAPELIALRAVQGLGAAAMFATTLSLLAAAYQGRDRSVALGVWGAVNGAAAAAGPVLGGVLTQGLGWRWIFFINLPVSVAAIWLTLRVVREAGRDRTRRVDWAGTACFALFAASVTYGSVRAGSDGWLSAATGVTAAVAVLALAAFVLVERRVAQPLVDLALFRRASFVTVMGTALVFSASSFTILAYVSVWLQTLLGMSPITGGLALLPLAASSFLVSAISGRLLHGVPARVPVGVGTMLVGAGEFAQAVLGAGSSWPALTAGLVVTGIGVGLVSPALSGAALASVPRHEAGMAGGALNTFRQLGYALGIAVFGTVVTSRIASSLHGTAPDPDAAARALAGGGAAALRGSVPGHALRAAFASGLDTAMMIAGGLAVVAGAAVLIWVRTPGHTAAPTVREGEKAAAVS
ncbi:MFS transporter [Streptomyces fuscigenes]|uniref:MFS transporter n=1 Tax=Streptomyces fuscigenes TaxID=1528880 RepID=UPI001F4897BF|nr:MFS transporter [Streptomyces fuscigenes]MCF3962576.1 MFS transporter [Streptomyces fuscigenes]